MTEHGAGDYKDLVVFLAAAGVMVPLFNRFKVSPVLGFLAAGVLLGPFGLARFADAVPWLRYLTIDDEAQMRQLSELGVAFLLFMIGLELSWGRLRAMRRLVFGLGLAQIVTCTAVLAGGFMLMGQTWVGAIVLGMGLALSSTAVVMPVLAERGRLKGTVGRSTFAVLLAQDLAVAPILITVTVMATLAQSGGELDPPALGAALFTLVPAAIGRPRMISRARPSVPSPSSIGFLRSWRTSSVQSLRIVWCSAQNRAPTRSHSAMADDSARLKSPCRNIGTRQVSEVDAYSAL